MKWIKTMEEPQGMILRWLETLSRYDFDIIFRPGAQHGNALTRLAEPTMLPPWNLGPRTTNLYTTSLLPD